MQQGLPPINADPTKVKDILIEIFKKLTEAAGPVNGRAMLKIVGPGSITPAEQRRVDILINTGSTIAPDKLPQVFRAFYGSKTSNHLGLGLTIASMLCHDGGADRHRLRE